MQNPEVILDKEPTGSDDFDALRIKKLEDVGTSSLSHRKSEADVTSKSNSIEGYGSLDSVRSSAEVLVACTTEAQSVNCWDSEPATSDNAKEHEMTSHEASGDGELIDGKEHLCEQRSTQSSGDQNQRSLSLDDTHQTPQSRSPCVEENNRKRQAIACTFFARGWCIKGNSCRFLHQNGSNSTNAGEDAEETNGFQLSGIQIERPSHYADTVTNSGLLQKHVSLVDGGKSGIDDQLHDPRFATHRATSSSVFRPEAEYQHVHSALNGFQQPPFEQDDAQKGLMLHPVLGVSVKSLVTNEGLQEHSSSSEVFLTHRNLNFHQRFNGIQSGSKDLHFQNFLRGATDVQETPERCFINNETIRRSAPFDLSNLTAKSETSLSSALNYRFVTNGLATGYGVYGKAGSQSLYDRNGRESLSPKKTSCLTTYDTTFSKLDEGTGCVDKTSFLSTLDYALDGDGSSYYRGITPPYKLECQTIHKLSGDDIGCPVSSYGCYPKNSPSYHTILEGGKLMDIVSKASTSRGNKTSSYSYSWEPSVPFRSSFVHASTSRASPGSQYDPIRDSIEPFNEGANGTLQASNFVQSSNVGNALPELSSSSNVITRYDDKALQKETSFYNTEVRKGPFLARNEHRALTPNEKMIMGYSAELQTASNMESCLNLAHQIDSEKNIKETKAMKCFRAALVDFVKELVKPSWRGGQLSKDAHKMVVKKSVDKVLSSIHFHQLPSDSEAIEQFLSLSHSKISRLVEGYVEKYAKFREPAN